MSDTQASSQVADTVVRSDSSVSQSGRTTTDPNMRLTTVLPRVEWKGDQPEVVPSQRARFELLGELGRGGMGEVVLARDNDIQRTVALKLLPPGADLGRVLRFVDEIRTVGRLEHPNIMPVHDVGIDAEGRYYFVMKHLHGDTLEAIINRLRAGDEATHAAYPFATRVSLFLGVLHAVAHAHQQGFLHRDLKPANIMIGPHGEVTLMDWGLARQFRAPRAPASLDPRAAACMLDVLRPSKRAPQVLTARPPSISNLDPVRDQAVTLTQVGSLMGTPLYMSPEQARGEHDKLDERSDIYALTVILHELLHLEHYLHGRKTKEEVLQGVQRDSPSPLDTGRLKCQAGVPAELNWFIHRGLQKDASLRHQTVEEMIAALQVIGTGRIRIQCPVTFMRRVLFEAQEIANNHPGVAMGIAGLLVATLAWGVVSAVFALVG